MPKDLGLAVAAGLVSATLFLAVLTGSAVGLITMYLAPLPLFAAGLGRGTVAAAVSGVVGIVAVALVTGGAILPYAIVIAVPVVVLVRQALLWRQDAEGKVEWYPSGLLLGVLLGLGAAAIAVAGVSLAGEEGGFAGVVKAMVAETIAALGSDLLPEQREQLVAVWAPFLPSMVVASWLLMTVANGTLAQGLLVRAGVHLRPSPRYRQAELPDWAAGLLLATALTAMLGDGSLAFAARNIAVLVLVGYVFPGLGWIHGRLAAEPNGGVWVAVFYGVFFVMFGWAVIVVAGLGLIRHWMRLGRKWMGTSQEED